MAVGPKNAVADTADSADTNLTRLSSWLVGCGTWVLERANVLADTADSADTIWAKPVQKNGADVVE